MGGLEIALLAFGVGGVALFSSIAVYLAQKRGPPRAQRGGPVPELDARLQPTDVPLTVRVLGDAGPHATGTSILVEGVCDRLVLRRGRLAPAAPPGAGTRDLDLGLRDAHELETGDPEIDAAYVVAGPPALVHAMLDAETRRQLRALTVSPASEVTVRQGRLQLDLSLNHRVDPRPVEGRGRAAVAMARRLLPPDDVARKLANNIRHDPLATVRLRNLHAAVREHPDHAETRAAMKAATADRHPEVRLTAARALGAEGSGVLLSMIDAYETADGYREAAIHALGAELPEELLARALRRCLGTRPGDPPEQPLSARACLTALAHSRTPEAVSRLQSLLLANRFLAADAARALGQIGGGEVEAVLIGALAGEVFESRLAAAEVLGAVGTAAAVPSLREAERQGVEMRRLARQAIAAIQARAKEAPGAVSLAGAEAGQVSMADDPSGQVSLPPGREREKG
jgi:HEAT repeat protein